MSIDLFQSRRNYNEQCRWWKRNESDEYEENEIVYKRIPSGSFSAKEVNAHVYTDVTIGGTFMFDKETVTIKTPDNVSGMTARDIVEYKGELYIVNDVQKQVSRMQNGVFGNEKNSSHFWYISLRK